MFADISKDICFRMAWHINENISIAINLLPSFPMVASFPYVLVSHDVTYRFALNPSKFFIGLLG